jgi:hypothetical protein
MAFREVAMFEVKEVIRLCGEGVLKKAIARVVVVDPKTVRHDVAAAERLGLAGLLDDDGLARLLAACPGGPESGQPGMLFEHRPGVAAQLPSTQRSSPTQSSSLVHGRSEQPSGSVAAPGPQRSNVSQSVSVAQGRTTQWPALHCSSAAQSPSTAHGGAQRESGVPHTSRGRGRLWHTRSPTAVGSIASQNGSPPLRPHSSESMTSPQVGECGE